MPESFSSFYHKIMSADGLRTNEQIQIDKFVSQKARELQNTKTDTIIDGATVEKLIRTLKKGISPGIDWSTWNICTSAFRHNSVHS